MLKWSDSANNGIIPRDHISVSISPCLRCTFVVRRRSTVLVHRFMRHGGIAGISDAPPLRLNAYVSRHVNGELHCFRIAIT